MLKIKQINKEIYLYCINATVLKNKKTSIK